MRIFLLVGALDVPEDVLHDGLVEAEAPVHIHLIPTALRPDGALRIHERPEPR